MKLTTIKKTAPLALLAVVLSGTAFAGHKDGHNPRGGDKGNLGSINAYNDCSIDPILKALVVNTMISDDSDDTLGTVAELGDITVHGKQKGKGPWQNLGASQSQQGDFGDNHTVILLCEGALDPKATVLNAEVEIEVLNAKPGKTYSGRCDDNPLSSCTDDYGVPYYCEEEDESIVDVPADICD
jgi:hypothetical protein